MPMFLPQMQNREELIINEQIKILNRTNLKLFCFADIFFY
jgi:hypothetical protein